MQHFAEQRWFGRRVLFEKWGAYYKARFDGVAQSVFGATKEEAYKKLKTQPLNFKMGKQLRDKEESKTNPTLRGKK